MQLAVRSMMNVLFALLQQVWTSNGDRRLTRMLLDDAQVTYGGTMNVFLFVCVCSLSLAARALIARKSTCPSDATGEAPACVSAASALQRGCCWILIRELVLCHQENSALLEGAT
jgi:hypothetical protein